MATRLTTLRIEGGTEQWWDTSDLIPNGQIVYSYGFLADDGSLFQCVHKTLEECRKARDLWLSKPRNEVTG